jgi:hypothetical protein
MARNTKGMPRTRQARSICQPEVGTEYDTTISGLKSFNVFIASEKEDIEKNNRPKKLVEKS